MSLRKRYCVANWKMNFTSSESRKFLLSLKDENLDNSNITTIICSSFIDIAINAQYINNNIKFSAQNIFYENKGAFTGEISCRMLKDVGCNWVLIGHSERRTIFLESYKMINKKLLIAINEGINPILCIGETLIEQENNQTNMVLSNQLLSAFENIQNKDINKVVIAYEPVWAIGTGKTATVKTIANNHALIRSILIEKGCQGEDISILYGGSVNSENASELANIENVDGFLIGGASLDLDSFKLIYNQL